MRAFYLVLFCIGLPFVAGAQTRDPRVDSLAKENADLKQRVADQDRRIADLEKSVKALLEAAKAAAAPVPIPAPVPLWHSPANWMQIKPGMSEAAVTDILGPPTSVQTAVDVRTLFYESDPKATTVMRGTVTLKDDRVTEMVPPSF